MSWRKRRGILSVPGCVAIENEKREIESAQVERRMNGQAS
jgi:hypothetical protein